MQFGQQVANWKLIAMEEETIKTTAEMIPRITPLKQIDAQYCYSCCFLASHLEDAKEKMYIEMLNIQEKKVFSLPLGGFSLFWRRFDVV